MAGARLAGRGIVLTRPRAQAVALARMLEAEGAVPLVFPTIEIQDLPDLKPFFELIDRLESFDLAIFISPNAVHKALNLARARRGERPWPPRLRMAAIGRGSRRELERAGFRAVIAPEANADSEALLGRPELADVKGMRVAIFRGEGGRELLAETLAARGATIEYAECYRRVRPAADCAPLLAAWGRGAVHAVCVSSIEGFANFHEMLGKLGQQWLRTTPLFAAHARIADEAQRRGVRETIVAGPDDAAVLDALVAYFRARQ